MLVRKDTPRSSGCGARPRPLSRSFAPLLRSVGWPGWLLPLLCPFLGSGPLLEVGSSLGGSLGWMGASPSQVGVPSPLLLLAGLGAVPVPLLAAVPKLLAWMWDPLAGGLLSALVSPAVAGGVLEYSRLPWGRWAQCVVVSDGGVPRAGGAGSAAG